MEKKKNLITQEVEEPEHFVEEVKMITETPINIDFIITIKNID